jgi:hypothetical protein
MTWGHSLECRLKFFWNLILITVLKCFNLPSSPPPTRGSGKERLLGHRGSGPVYSLEQILSALSGKKQFCWQESAAAAAAQSTGKHFMNIPAVHFSSVGRANTNQKQWHDTETARSQPSWHKSAGVTRTTRDARRSSLSCLSQRNENQQRQETRKCCSTSTLCKLCNQVLPPSLAMGSNILHRSCLTTCLASANESLSRLHLSLFWVWHHSVNQCKPEEAARRLRNLMRSFLVLFSLWNHNKWSSITQCKVNQNIHVFSEKSFIMHSFFSETSFHLCLPQQKTFLFVSALANHPSTCVCFMKTRVCPSKTPSNTTDFPKKP